MSLLQNLILLLISAHLLGRLATLLGQPELVGHILAGTLLGPAVLGRVMPSDNLNVCADLAVLIIVMVAGLEVQLKTITRLFTGWGVLALLPGFLLPVAAGLLLGLLFGYEVTTAIVIALCIAVTALPVALRILVSFGLQNTQLAQITIAGALSTDIVVLLALGALTSIGDGTQYSIPHLIGYSGIKLLALVALVACSSWLYRRVYPRLTQQNGRSTPVETSFALALILSLAAAADALSLHFAIGAFLGALIVSESQNAKIDSEASCSHPLRLKLEGACNLFFAPFFLAYQGTHLTSNSLNQPAFALALILVAIATKLTGGYWGARIYGLSAYEARGTAIVMNARGLMEMVVATIAFRAGLVDRNLFSTLLVVGMFTTLLTPILLRRWQKQPPTGVTLPTTE